MFRFNGLFVLLAVSVIAITGTWLNQLWQEQQQFTNPVNKAKIDYYLSDFSLVSISGEGETQFSLKGDHFVHNRTRGSSEIYNPVMTLESDQQTLIINAEEAKQYANDNIELSGDVVIEKEKNEVSPGYSLKTSELLYSAEDKVLQTEALIELTSTEDALISGTGFINRLANEEITINNNVHAEYTPSSP